MNRKLDTNRLFLSQVSAHVEELTGMLTLGPRAPINDVVDRGLLSTSMLANSASLMDLAEWESFLNGLGRLLQLYKEKNLPWDERIAQLTSEIIEREEVIVSEWSDQTEGIRKLFVPDEWEILSQELSELVEMSEAAAARPEDWNAPAADAGQDANGTGQRSQAPVAEGGADDRPLSRSVKELEARARDLVENWERSSWNLDDAAPADLEALRRDLYLMDFYSRTVERTLATTSHMMRSRVTHSLEPIRVAVEDYAGMLYAKSNRRVDVTFVGEDLPIDVRLLMPVQRVVQLMIGDIFLRCDDEYLRVEVHVSQQSGSLLWSIRDNGSNFMTDSPIDPDEYLAFYPGLKETGRVLMRLHSLLWVEPDEDHETRFAFTIPESPEGGTFIVFGENEDQFAVPASQVSAVFSEADATLHTDERGEYLVQNGRRARIVRLGQLYSEGPVDGDTIVVIGSLEKRVAFYVSGEGRLERGEWLHNCVPAWKGMNPGGADIESRRLPLVEANGLIDHYHRLINDTHNEGLSGGVVGDEDLSQTQAKKVKDAATPPPSIASGRVLIVERSVALRESLSTILAARNVEATTVGSIEDAMEWMSTSEPDLIVSEFRVPSMAAKILAERVKHTGMNIPILVTTSHVGDDAELLVSKLGIAGYISKPFKPEDVWNQVGSHLSRAVAETPR